MLFFHQNKTKFDFGLISLQLNALNRFKIRAVYNEIHVFKRFLYGIYMEAILSSICNLLNEIRLVS